MGMGEGMEVLLRTLRKRMITFTIVHFIGCAFILSVDLNQPGPDRIGLVIFAAIFGPAMYFFDIYTEIKKFTKKDARDG
jgi:hypothetical protein